MCERVPKLTRNIEVLKACIPTLPPGEKKAELIAALRDAVLGKKVAYRCLMDRAAGIEAYQKALRDGCSVEAAIHAGISAEDKAIGLVPSRGVFAPFAGFFGPAPDERSFTVTIVCGERERSRIAPTPALQRGMRLVISDNVPDPIVQRISRIPDTMPLYAMSTFHEALLTWPKNRTRIRLSKSEPACLRRGVGPRYRELIPQFEHLGSFPDSVSSRLFRIRHYTKTIRAIEVARKFQRSAVKWREFCSAFEFPKVCDQEAMEKAAARLIRTVPREHLEALAWDYMKRGLLSGRSRRRKDWRRGRTAKAKREPLTFVRQQDVNLAMEL
jgi:hypothetical protein